MNQPRASTIKDIAKLSGYSVRTVSRVVNNQGEISETTRTQIQKIIDKYNYQPNFWAKSLATQETKTIAVVTSSIEYYGVPNNIVGIEKVAEQAGYSIFLHLNHRPQDIDISSLVNNILSRRVDGIIWNSPNVNNSIKAFDKKLIARLPPIVFINIENNLGFSSVSLNNVEGSVLATEHLISQKYKKIGIITGPLLWWEAKERLVGFKQAMAKAGIPVLPTLIAEGDWRANSGARAMAKLINDHPDISAVFVCNDQMAVGAMSMLAGLGKKIPDDIAIIGFDDIPESAYFIPPLSTIENPTMELGELAFNLLLELISNKGTTEMINEWLTYPNKNMVKNQLVKPKLIIRKSSVKV